LENWYALQELEVPWLVYGLLVNDSSSAFVGKSKAGKSSAIRNLAVAVVKGRPFLGREVFVPKEGGTVLYIHLDRKDPVAYVASELRALGITDKEATRLHLMSAQDMPKEDDGRMKWLVEQVTRLRPTLVIIDLLFQFICVDNSNDYNKNLKAINELQDHLRVAEFHGHLVTAHHARKANGSVDAFDDLLGSSAIRGSFSTNVLLVNDRKNKRHTIQTDQTQRVKELGEIEETIIERNPETAEMFLGSTIENLKVAQKKATQQADGDDVFHFIEAHSGCTQTDIMKGLKMSKVQVLRYLESLGTEMISRSGTGRSGRPFKYSVKSMQEVKQ
jgi:RecA-family ATPase